MTSYIKRVICAKKLAADFMSLAIQVEADCRTEADRCSLPHKLSVHPYNGGHVNAAMRRKSMDLTLALSALRETI